MRRTNNQIFIYDTFNKMNKKPGGNKKIKYIHRKNYRNLNRKIIPILYLIQLQIFL